MTQANNRYARVRRSYCEERLDDARTVYLAVNRRIQAWPAVCVRPIGQTLFDGLAAWHKLVHLQRFWRSEHDHRCKQYSVPVCLHARRPGRLAPARHGSEGEKILRSRRKSNLSRQVIKRLETKRRSDQRCFFRRPPPDASAKSCRHPALRDLRDPSVVRYCAC
jgi:hypothetical protein